MRLEMTRTIVAGSSPEEILSITAWRLVPLPDIRTVRRIGCVIVYILIYRIVGRLDFCLSQNERSMERKARSVAGMKPKFQLPRRLENGSDASN